MLSNDRCNVFHDSVMDDWSSDDEGEILTDQSYGGWEPKQNCHGHRGVFPEKKLSWHVVLRLTHVLTWT